jgi:sigma-B regulation protein RsbU (phosphoserine phosphatase)
MSDASSNSSAAGIKVLLIDGNGTLAESVVPLFSTDPAIAFLLCRDVPESLAAAGGFKPTVLVLNPGIAGNDATALIRLLRSDTKTGSIPLMVLSPEEISSGREKVFEAGADDYLVPLPGKTELLARLRHHSRIHHCQLQRDEAQAALQVQQGLLAKELGEAAGYVSSLLPAPIKNEKGISADWRYIPSSSLGGDTFSYLWLDENRFILELLDVCGHGVGAALLSMSVINTLRSRNALRERKPRPPAEVLSSLNTSFPMENNNQMYFTMWFGVFDITTRELTYASGGHPPAIALAPDGTVSLLSTPGLVIGALPEAVYTERTVILQPGTRIFLFSDGCYEVRKQPGNELMSLEDFTEILKKPGQSLDGVIEEIRNIQGKPDFVDDFSLVEFRFA